MHSRSVKTVDPRIPERPGRSTRRVFTGQADIACTKREALWCVIRGRMKGELHPTKNHLGGGLPHLVRMLFLHVGYQLRYFFGLLVWLPR